MNNSSIVQIIATSNTTNNPCGEEDACFSAIGSTLLTFLESSYCQIIIGVIWSLLVLFGILGNGLVIFIAIFYRKLNDITNCYIFNLAITDLLFVLFCIPFTTYLYLSTSYYGWVFGVAFCKLNHFISHASVQSTCMTLTAMTIHRCNLIIQNQTMNQNSANIKKRQRTVLLITILIWIVSFLISSPDLIYYTVTEQTYGNETLTICSFDTNTYAILKFYISISHFVSIATTYLIPLSIIILSYTRLLSHLSKNQRRLAKFTNSNKGVEKAKSSNKKLVNDESNTEFKSLTVPKRNTKSKKQKKSERRRRKVTQMVAVVTLNFGVCWLPTHLFIILRSLLSEYNDLYPYLSLFKLMAHTLSYLTPVVNPCLYAFYNENFRNSLYDLWHKISCKASVKNVRNFRTNSKSGAY